MISDTDAGAQLQRTPTKVIDIAGGVSYLQPRLGGGTDSRFPSTGSFFPPAAIPGFEKQPAFLRSDASFALDWRDNPLHPHAGGRYGVQFSDYRDRDFDTFGFEQVSIDLQQYCPSTTVIEPSRYTPPQCLRIRVQAKRSRSTFSRRWVAQLGASRFPGVSLPRPQQSAAERRIPLGSVVGT
jgi:hypothetical protein